MTYKDELAARKKLHTDERESFFRVFRQIHPDPSAQAKLDAAERRYAALQTKMEAVDFMSRNRVAEALSRIYLMALGHDTTELLLDKVVLNTPLGDRRIDAYLPKERIAVESKFGHQSLTKKLKCQADKDGHLLKQGAIRTCHWLIYTKASDPLLAYLRSKGIEVAYQWFTDELWHYFFEENTPSWLPREGLTPRSS